MALTSFAATHPLDGQVLSFSAALPCTRLLNATDRIGCATRSHPATAPLFVAADHAALSSLLNDVPGGELVLALAAPLFEASTLREIRDTFGAALRGILVLHSPTPPAGIGSPAPRSPWLEMGSGLTMERFPFGIVLLTAAESAAVLEHTTSSSAPSDGAADAPLVELRYPMHARDNAPRCLAAVGCLPVGGQSVWGSLTPLVADSTTADAPSVLIPAAKPTVALATQLDASAFFHDQAPGAYAAASSIVALLAAVDAIVSADALRVQLPSLPATPLFFLFTAEAWDGIGSRRFLTDLHNFTCTRPARAPSARSPPSPGVRGPPPPPQACAAPYKPDLTFTQLRAAGISTLVHLGPVGAASGDAGLFVHTPPDAPSTAADALRNAAAAHVPVRAATAGQGLPPGPGRAFADPKLAVARRGLVSHSGTTDVVTLSDFDRSYRLGGRFGSRFDTLDALDASRVCDAAGVAARAFWSLVGGTGTPAVDCGVVTQLLACLLPPAGNQTRFAAAKEAVEERDTTFAPEPPDEEARAAQRDYEAACPLARELGFDQTTLASRYSGVFVEGRISDPTTLFVKAWLDARLNVTCPPVADVEAPAPCAPAVMYHDAYPPGIEPEGDEGAWRVVDLSEPLWAESNWPDEMYSKMYPYGAPRTAEIMLLLSVGVGGAIATYIAVAVSRRSYKQAYKRL